MTVTRRIRPSGAPARRWAIEPAAEKRTDSGGGRWWWRRSPCGLLFRSWAPTCNTCGFPVTWLAEPIRGSDGRRGYKVACGCGSDLIVVDFPLQVGGTAEWWLEFDGTITPDA